MRNCDYLIHAGDLGGSSALDALLAMAPANAIRGNNDSPEKWPAAEREGLATLPDVARIEMRGGHIIVIHGHQFAKAKQRHQHLREAYPDALAVVYGHSHHLQVDKGERPWVLNPGACGRARTFGGPSALIIGCASPRIDVKVVRFAPMTRAAKRRTRA